MPRAAYHGVERGMVRVASALRPESWSRLAGESPVRVGTGVPGSRPGLSLRGGGLSGASRASLEGASARAAALSEPCSLVKLTTGEPSRSRRGEGHVRQALFRGQPAGSFRGMEGGTCAKSGPEQERPVCLARVGQGRGA
jgi:hypothetical protein